MNIMEFNKVAAIVNLEIAKGHELNAQKVIEVLAKETKQRNDTIPEYERGGRTNSFENLHQEIKIFQEYLPAQLTEAEVREIVQTAIAESGVSTKKELEKVMAV